MTESETIELDDVNLPTEGNEFRNRKNKNHITINVSEDKDEEMDVNPYVKYFINDKSFRIVFSAGLSTTIVVFCIVKLFTLDENNPQFTTYISILTSLNMLWVPIQMLKNKKKRIAWK